MTIGARNCAARKRLFLILLSFALLLLLLPLSGLFTTAARAAVTATVAPHDGVGHLYINGTEVPDAENRSASGEGWSWYAPKHMLTLDNFTGSQIYWSGAFVDGRANPINITIKGTCVVNTGYGSDFYITTAGHDIAAICSESTVRFTCEGDNPFLWCYGYEGIRAINADFSAAQCRFVIDGYCYGLYAAHSVTFTEPQVTVRAVLMGNNSRAVAMHCDELHVFASDTKDPYITCTAIDNGLPGECYGLEGGNRFELSRNGTAVSRSDFKQLATVTLSGSTSACTQAPEFESQCDGIFLSRFGYLYYYPWHVEGAWNGPTLVYDYIGYGASEEQYTYLAYSLEPDPPEPPKLAFSKEDCFADYPATRLTCNTEFSFDFMPYVSGGAAPYTFADEISWPDGVDYCYSLSPDGVLTLKVPGKPGPLNEGTFPALAVCSGAGIYLYEQDLKFSVTDAEGSVIHIDGINVGYCLPPLLQLTADLPESVRYSESEGGLIQLSCAAFNAVTSKEDGISYEWFYRDLNGKASTFNELQNQHKITFVKYSDGGKSVSFQCTGELSLGHVFCEASIARNDLKNVTPKREFLYTTECQILSEQCIDSVVFSMSDPVHAEMPRHGETPQSVFIDRPTYEAILSWKIFNEEDGSWQWTYAPFEYGRIYRLNAQITPKAGYQMAREVSVSLYGKNASCYTLRSDLANYHASFAATEGLISLVELTGYGSVEEGDTVTAGSPVVTATPHVSAYSIWYRNGSKISKSGVISHGDWYATVRLSADEDYEFAPDAVVKLDGVEMPIEYRETDNSAVRVRLPALHYECSHSEIEIADYQYDEDQHWKICPMCKEACRLAAHSYETVLDGGDSVTRCKYCGYEQLREPSGLTYANRIRLTADWAIIGNELPNYKIAPDYWHQAMLTGVRWYVSDTYSTTDLPADAVHIYSAVMEAGKYYYAELTLEAKNKYYFDKNTLFLADDNLKFTLLKHTGNNYDGTALIRISPYFPAEIRYTIPELEPGKTYGEIYDEYLVTSNGDPVDNTLSLTVNGETDTIWYDTSTETWHLLPNSGSQTSDPEIIHAYRSRKVQPNTEYKLQNFISVPDALILDSNIEVTNPDAAAIVTKGGALGIAEVDAIYQSGDNVVDYINVTVAEPVFDKEAPFGLPAQDGHYVLTQIGWDFGGESLSAGDKFREEGIYGLTVSVKPDDDYRMADADSIAVKVNGAAPSGYELLDFNSSTGLLTFRCTFFVTPHDYGGWFVEKEGTCSRDGLMVRVCAVCGHRDVKTFRSGHVYEYHSPQQSDCCTYGHETYYSCENCEKIFDASYQETTIEAVTYSTLNPDRHFLMHLSHDAAGHWLDCACGKTHMSYELHSYDEQNRCTVCETGIDVSRSGNTVRVGGNLAAGWTVVLAEYDADGKLLGISTVTVDDADGLYSLTARGNGAKTRTFFLDTKYRPPVNALDIPAE